MEMAHQKPEHPLHEEDQKQYAGYARYSGIAIQMFAIIAIGVFAGVKIDQWIEWKFPLFTVIFSLLFVSVAIFLATRDLINKK
jgi:F0F1-type ATP synthase assembly protein I